MRRAAIMAALLVGVALSHAQPPEDVERAKQHYTAGQQAMTDGRFTDAVAEFGAAYDITKDPVLFYKIGTAHEKAGKCDVALIYYDRYLKEARPDPQFVALTEERIEACGGGAAKPPEPPAPAPTPPAPTPPVAEPAPPATEPAAPATTVVKARHQGPWILVGGSIAMLTIGAVLAYSAEASENDLEDLYVGLQGTPPVFDGRTRERYDALIEEGERYERLSWISFALAGGLAAGAAVWFYLSPSGSTVITPTVTEKSAGVQTTIRF